MLHRNLTLFGALAFLSANAVVQSAQAQDNTLNLQQPVTFVEAYENHNPQSSAIKLGLMHIEQPNADATGGSVIVSVDKYPGCPAGSSQRFLFRWTQLLPANGKCINEDPSMRLYTGDPFGGRPGSNASFYYDPSRHLPYGPPGSGNAFSHTPGPFQVYFAFEPKMCTPAAIAEARQRNSTGSSTGACSIGINIGNFSPPLGFDLRVNYLYAPGRAARGPSVPLKLFWSAQRGDNFTTATAQGESDALAAGYVFVRVDGYVFPTQ